MRPRRFILPQAGTGGYGIRPYIFCGGRSPLAEAVPRVELSPFVESEIRRGAFYMRPRRFILPQAGTGGYGIRPYVFCGGRRPPRRRRCSAWSFLPLSKTKSVGAHSICARGSLPYRKRARADMESAPTFFVAGGVPSQRRCPAWSCLPLLKARSVGAHSICARGGLSYRKRARADMESAPTFFCRGGQGVRFCLLCVQADLFPLAPCQKPSYVVYYFSTSPQANPVQTGDAKL